MTDLMKVQVSTKNFLGGNIDKPIYQMTQLEIKTSLKMIQTGEIKVCSSIQSALNVYLKFLQTSDKQRFNYFHKKNRDLQQQVYVGLGKMFPKLAQACIQ